jgi:hypothetical protein
MTDSPAYDPDGVLERLPNKGPHIREAIDWWLEDVAPKLPGLAILLRLEEGDRYSPEPLKLWIEMRSGCVLAMADIANIVPTSNGKLLGQYVGWKLDDLHRLLIMHARKDPERWRKSVGR